MKKSILKSLLALSLFVGAANINLQAAEVDGVTEVDAKKFKTAHKLTHLYAKELKELQDFFVNCIDDEDYVPFKLGKNKKLIIKEEYEPIFDLLFKIKPELKKEMEMYAGEKKELIFSASPFSRFVEWYDEKKESKDKKSLYQAIQKVKKIEEGDDGKPFNNENNKNTLWAWQGNTALVLAMKNDDITEKEIIESLKNFIETGKVKNIKIEKEEEEEEETREDKKTKLFNKLNNKEEPKTEEKKTSTKRSVRTSTTRSTTDKNIRNKK